MKGQLSDGFFSPCRPALTRFPTSVFFPSSVSPSVFSGLRAPAPAVRGGGRSGDPRRRTASTASPRSDSAFALRVASPSVPLSNKQSAPGGGPQLGRRHPRGLPPPHLLRATKSDLLSEHTCDSHGALPQVTQASKRAGFSCTDRHRALLFERGAGRR